MVKFRRIVVDWLGLVPDSVWGYSGLDLELFFGLGLVLWLVVESSQYLLLRPYGSLVFKREIQRLSSFLRSASDQRVLYLIPASLTDEAP